MYKINKFFLSLGIFMLGLPLGVGAKQAASVMAAGGAPISQDVYWLHLTVFWICVGIGIVVFGVLIYALIHHRKSRAAQTTQFHKHTIVEIIWAVIPFLILIIMAIPASKILLRGQKTAPAPQQMNKVDGRGLIPISPPHKNEE